jgi:hypothetical protein
MILRKRGDTTMLELIESHDEGRSGHLSKFLKESFACFERIYGDFLDLQDISLIHALTHLHDRHACFFFSMQKCGLDRRGSSILREDRAMNIDTHLLRHIEDLLGEDAPIGDDDEIVTIMVR